MQVSGFCLAFLVLTAPGGLFAATPIPLEILKNTAKGSSQAYQGRLVSFVQDGNQTQMTDVRISFQPPDKYRKEFLTPREKVEKLVVSDGNTEWIQFPDKKTAWKGDSSKTYEKLLTEEQEWDLISKNYDLILHPEERIAGRQAWVIGIEPKAKGKPRRTLWIDQEEPLILQSKDYDPEGTLMTRSHFTDIEFVSGFPSDTFAPSFSSDTRTANHGMDPDFLSIKDLQGADKKSVPVPQSLPDGFVFESADTISVKGKNVSHLRFTDGLNVISLFESRSPIAHGTRMFAQDKTEPGLGRVRFSRAGKVIYWEKGGENFILVGNLSSQVLKKIKDSIK